MQRCLQLARLGAGTVAPNPMVGALLVYEGRIIGEGYHQYYGGPHAEVNCIASVRKEDAHLISQSTLYVSLEPCAHFGKTPPCTQLIIRHKIPRVVVGCTDPFAEVNGKGIAQLRAAGVEVMVPVLEDECRNINRRFFTFHEKQRPWILLKWAASANGKIGRQGERITISGPAAQRLVHKWRSEEAAIMVATNTVLTDNPLLTNRYWGKQQPLRVLLDMYLRIPTGLPLFQHGGKVLVFNGMREEEQGNIHYCYINKELPLLPQIFGRLHAMQVQSVMVEGGAHLLNSLIDADLWDEARIITHPSLVIQDGLDAPRLRKARKVTSYYMGNDFVEIYHQV